MLFATDLRNGVVFKYDNSVWIVVKFEFIKMGRGSGTVKVKARNVLNGSIVEKGFSQQMKFEEAFIEKRSGQYVYKDDTFAYFMDSSTFDQFGIPLDNVEESVKFLSEGDKVVIVYLDGQPITIEIPRSVVMRVKYTEPAVKGNTSTNALKRAVLQNGLEIQVPLFVDIGDYIKVNTDTCEYVERVKGVSE